MYGKSPSVTAPSVTEAWDRLRGGRWRRRELEGFLVPWSRRALRRTWRRKFVVSTTLANATLRRTSNHRYDLLLSTYRRPFGPPVFYALKKQHSVKAFGVFVGVLVLPLVDSFAICSA